MRRGLMVGIVVAVMLVACTAQAGYYGGLRFAGPLNWKEFAFGMQSGSFGAEVGVGYTNITITDLESLDIGLDGLEPSATLMTLSGAVFFEIAGNQNYGFDVGARGQYIAVSGEVDLSDLEVKGDDETIKATLSGLAFGPVLRGRWYLVQDSIAIGPEIYLCYSNWSTEIELGSDSFDGPGATIMDIEYSLRMDFYF